MSVFYIWAKVTHICLGNCDVSESMQSFVIDLFLSLRCRLLSGSKENVLTLTIIAVDTQYLSWYFNKATNTISCSHFKSSWYIFITIGKNSSHFCRSVVINIFHTTENSYVYFLLSLMWIGKGIFPRIDSMYDNRTTNVVR